MIGEVTRDAVIAAIAQCDALGRERFRDVHGYRRASAYEVTYRRRRYDSKAIVGVAYGLQHGGDPLHPSEFSGGMEHSARRLVRLGFSVYRGRERLTADDVAIPLRLTAPKLEPELRLYVCRPTSERSVAACHEHKFGALLSPIEVRETGSGAKIRDMSGHVYPLEGRPYVLDNGAWGCWQARAEWRSRPFARLVERLGSGAEWLVLPDIVSGGLASLDRSIGWLTEHRGWLGEHGVSTVALAVQDGMTVDVVRPLLEQHEIGVLFVGGSAGVGTPNWKWRTLHDWAELGLDLGIRVHVGRVNGLRRALLCRELGVTSIDGSSVTRFSVNAPLMAQAHDDVEAVRDVEGARYACKRRRFELALGRPF